MQIPQPWWTQNRVYQDVGTLEATRMRFAKVPGGSQNREDHHWLKDMHIYFSQHKFLKFYCQAYL